VFGVVSSPTRVKYKRNPALCILPAAGATNLNTKLSVLAPIYYGQREAILEGCKEFNRGISRAPAAEVVA
jgi:hypothetical protein